MLACVPTRREVPPLKNLFKALLLPFPLGVLLAAAGALAWHRRWARACVLTGVLLLLLAGNPWLGNQALLAIEQQHAPLAAPPAGISSVVVLSAGAHNEPWRLGADRLDDATLRRMEEGLRLWALTPDATLLLSGGGHSGPPVARAMRTWALARGVPANRIAVEEQSMDTHDQAVALAPRLRGQRSLLVTSASHMPRALGLFRDQGIDPVAAPTHFLATTALLQPWWALLLPNRHGLERSTTAAYEALGLAWTRLRGQRQPAN